MKTFKIINLQTWEIDTISKDSEAKAITQFKNDKGLKDFDRSLYEIKEQNPKKQKSYSTMTFNQFKAKEFHNIKI